MTQRHWSLHKVKALELPVRGVYFPLKEEYDRQNHTLAGLTEIETRRQAEGDLFPWNTSIPACGKASLCSLYLVY